jgi:hypothetical protein
VTGLDQVPELRRSRSTMRGSVIVVGDTADLNLLTELLRQANSPG